MFDEPSSGSKSRQYLPHLKCSGIWMMPGSSSDAMAQSRPPWSIALTMISFASTSSFCCTSPCTFSVSVDAEDVGETGAAHLVGDHLRGEREIVQDAGELTRRFRMVALLLDDEALDRDDRCCSVFDHAASSCPRLDSARGGAYSRASTSNRFRNIAAAHRLPQIQNRERPAGLKLMNVSDLVQEQFCRRVARDPAPAKWCARA